MKPNHELSHLVQHMTPEERNVVDAIIVGADTSGDGQMELVLALRSGCTLENLVTG
jgi:hypothetical protein